VGKKRDKGMRWAKRSVHLGGQGCYVMVEGQYCGMMPVRMYLRGTLPAFVTGSPLLLLLLLLLIHDCLSVIYGLVSDSVRTDSLENLSP
jgi:hypothetical protein